MAKRQWFNIKYPFTNNGYQKFFVDTNETLTEKVRSQIMHVIFTPKGQRIRNPEFGTDLIKFIFSENDTDSWEGVKNEILDAIKTYVSNCTINDINVVRSDDGNDDIFVRIDYSILEGNKVINDSIGVQL